MMQLLLNKNFLLLALSRSGFTGVIKAWRVMSYTFVHNCSSMPLTEKVAEAVKKTKTYFYFFCIVYFYIVL